MRVSVGVNVCVSVGLCMVGTVMTHDGGDDR